MIVGRATVLATVLLGLGPGLSGAISSPAPARAASGRSADGATAAVGAARTRAAANGAPSAKTKATADEAPSVKTRAAANAAPSAKTTATATANAAPSARPRIAAANGAPSVKTKATANGAPSTRPRTAANPTPSATLTAAFNPERLGRRTTLSFDFRIVGAAGAVPPALTEIDLSYPHKLGIALSGLGLATCTAAALEASGLTGCQADSIMGFGDATAEISLGSDVVAETVPITILRAPDEEHHIALLLDAVGTAPLNTTAVFPGALLPAPLPYGGTVSIDAPLIPSVPGAPDVAVVALHATLGPAGVTYYEHVPGETLGYQPPGLLLPPSCPHGGFPFAVRFSFVGGTQASAQAVDPCPARAGRPGRRSASGRG
jgi:hypothetical protein